MNLFVKKKKKKMFTRFILHCFIWKEQLLYFSFLYHVEKKIPDFVHQYFLWYTNFVWVIRGKQGS